MYVNKFRWHWLFTRNIMGAWSTTYAKRHVCHFNASAIDGVILSFARQSFRAQFVSFVSENSRAVYDADNRGELCFLLPHAHTCITVIRTGTHSHLMQYMTPKGGPKSANHVVPSSRICLPKLHSEIRGAIVDVIVACYIKLVNLSVVWQCLSFRLCADETIPLV